MYVACAYGNGYAYIITVHRYDADAWLDPWTRRKQFMKTPTLCVECGTLEHKFITHQQPWGADLYEFENVPALVCRQCGEVYLAAEVTQRIDAIIKEHPAPKRYHQVPVFSLSDS